MTASDRAALTPEMAESIKVALEPAEVLALTAWGEGRARLDQDRGWVANPLDAMVDIINVVDNRARDPRWSRLTHKAIALQRRQFSCWDPAGGADNFSALMARAQQLLADETPSDKLLGCLAAAEGCLAGSLVDALFGATHYCADWLDPWPVWAFHEPARRYGPLTPVAHRWGHLFFNNVE